MKNNELTSLLLCPKTLENLIYDEDKNLLISEESKNKYEIYKQIPLLFSQNKEIDKNIKSWWGDLYKQLYLDLDNSLTKENLFKKLKKFENLMKKMDHLLHNEMLSLDFKNKICLEIGPGSGAHSALLKYYGAKIISADITIERCISTAKKLNFIDGNHLVINCSAEKIPLKDNSIDLVYSNGVLHHADNTENCFTEINRILKKNGKTIISLYCRSSAEYYLNILPKAFIFGSIFRNKKEANWIGEITEGKPKFSNMKNPVTRVYNKKEIYHLFKDFEIISIRKHCFSFKDFCIPRLTQFREWFLNKMGYEFYDGKIVYGRDVIPFTNLEKYLSKFFGFFWYIVAKKK